MRHSRLGTRNARSLFEVAAGDRVPRLDLNPDSRPAASSRPNRKEAAISGLLPLIAASFLLGLIVHRNPLFFWIFSGSKDMRGDLGAGRVAAEIVAQLMAQDPGDILEFFRGRDSESSEQKRSMNREEPVNLVLVG
jgi:hypothetical protein